ncbi:MAG: hypothetical protein JOZ81_18485, partial [Chloroflexi bacterium]|nr:hypothetical protein [Chloroflexota bacterium]
MALVVTARSTGAIAAARPHVLPLRWLAPLVAGWAAALFTVQQVAHVALPTGIFGDALQVASVVTFGLALGVCLSTWLSARDDAAQLFAATVAPMFIAAQIIATQVLQALELATLADVTNATLGLLGVGALTWCAVAGRSARNAVATSARGAMLRYVLKVALFVVFAAALSGFITRAVGASWACDGSLLCRFGDDTLTDAQVYHRLLSYVGGGLLVWAAIEALRLHGRSRNVQVAAGALAGTTVAQAAAG